MQRDVMALGEVDFGHVLHGLGVDDNAIGVARGLVAHKAHQDTRILFFAVGLGNEDWLPRQLPGDVLTKPLEHLLRVVVLFREPQHAVVVDDAEAVLVPNAVDLRVDLGLVEAIVWPARARDLARCQVHLETAHLSAATTPVLNIAASGLTKREADGRLVVAHNIEDDAIVLFEAVDAVEEEERIRLEGRQLLSSLPVDQPDQRWPVRLPGVVVVKVALVLPGKQPTALSVEHAIPVQRVWDLDHHDVLLGQPNGVHRRWMLRRDPGDEITLELGAQFLGLIGLDRVDNVLRGEFEVFLVDNKLDRARKPLACHVIKMRFCMEDQDVAVREHVVEGDLAKRRHAAELEFDQGGAHRHGAQAAVRELRDVQVAVLVVRRLEHILDAIPDEGQMWPGAGLAHGNAAGFPVRAMVGGVEPLVPVLGFAVAVDADAVQHGLPIHPVDKLVFSELELCRTCMHEATTQPCGQRALDPQVQILDLLICRLQPAFEIDADIVRALGTLEWIHVGDQPRRRIHAGGLELCRRGRAWRAFGVARDTGRRCDDASLTTAGGL
mmetsp:Transcript_177731/g.569817  ORF Transcript_177731/g.569817 Transcript_177731/m.569817 type:complete len:552 (+) Transcript_177731:216-1871(+)